MFVVILKPNKPSHIFNMSTHQVTENTYLRYLEQAEKIISSGQVIDMNMYELADLLIERSLQSDKTTSLKNIYQDS